MPRHNRQLIYYEHSFITEHPYSREIERFTIGHPGLVHGVGHADDCHLIASIDIPDAIIARDGGDRLDAFLYDLTEFAAPVLAQPCDEFFDIIRRGFRSFSIE